jgi:predicted glycosyltransferase
MNKKHLLVVVFFQNSDLKELAYNRSYTIRDLYTSVVAERMITMKARMAREMKQFGIQTILTNPEELSANVINKYLELKARGRF